MKRTDRGDVDPFIQQDRIDFCDGEIDQSFLMKQMKCLLAFGFRERPGRSCLRAT
jgi:hypothetical protein